MNEQEENIVFEDIFNSISFSNPSAHEVKVPVQEEKEYPSLYDELVDKCNPLNFRSPYNPQKLDIANDLYAEIIQYNCNTSEEILKNIRDRAIQSLQITFSTKKLMEKLLEYCDPAVYMNPYDHDNVALANKFYSEIQDSSNDIMALERIEERAMELFHCHQKSILQEKETKEEDFSQLLKEEEQKAMTQIDPEYFGYYQ